MNIKTVVVGNLQTNCYILENDTQCIIIDPGAEPEKIEKELQKELVGIIITHSHLDHTGGLLYFVNKYKVKIYDYNNLKEGLNTIGTFTFDVIYTLGHTKDSITIYFNQEKVMFVGDFVFFHTVGRTDLNGGDFEQMKSSIAILKHYDDVTLYPGHGRVTTLKEEKSNNIYFQ
ncbi:MAG: MBL fold metallo-hydrolase [Firmicutes bacterium]|nr:MBL fold metallo-hydrolase [Bacillota bacterium]